MIIALTAGLIFDGSKLLENHVLLVENGFVKNCMPLKDCPTDLTLKNLGDFILSPGFIDLQVNGGGGYDFTAETTYETAVKIAKAHRKYGTTAILPTLITSDKNRTEKAITEIAHHQNHATDGLLGLHLEGPFLNPEKSGIHPPEHMQKLSEAFCATLQKTKGVTTLITIAPETQDPELLKELSEPHIFLSIGHSNAPTSLAASFLKDGFTSVTHLFNAMSGLDHRAPGVALAALQCPECYCGIIADLHHVSPEMLKFAYQLKGADKLYLVTDAVSPAASEQSYFDWNGQRLWVQDGALKDQEGRLAGAVLTLDQAIRNCHMVLSIPLEDCLKMATLTPARFLKKDHLYGQFKKGCRADLTLLSRENLTVKACYLATEIEQALL